VTDVVSDWRLLAERPGFVRGEPVPDVLRPFIVGEWRMLGPTLIVHDPVIPPGENWLRICEAATGQYRRFLSWISDVKPGAMIRYYVPTASGTGFRAEQPLYEGYWRRSVDESDELPWPNPEPTWDVRAAFLSRLDRVEGVAARVAYRGFSTCRLCGQRNGHEALRSARWEWPAGFRHYVAQHDVRPSSAFIDFIRNAP
jgi:hypothetical protein